MERAEHNRVVEEDDWRQRDTASGRSGVEVVGHGPVRVVVAHGWTTDSGCYAPILEFVDLNRFTFAFVDARGYGAARQKPGSYTLAEVGADLVAVATKLGWDRFSLMGHSMGGMAIQHALLRAPERVAALVGIAPVPASGTPMPEEMITLFRSAVTSLESRRLIFDISTGQRRDGRWLDAQSAASMEVTESVPCRSYLDDWTTSDISAQVAGSEVPTLVVVGECDPGITKERAEQAWGLLYPNLTVSVVQGAGHYPMSEAPEALTATVTDFLVEHR